MLRSFGLRPRFVTTTVVIGLDSLQAACETGEPLDFCHYRELFHATYPIGIIGTLIFDLFATSRGAKFTGDELSQHCEGMLANSVFAEPPPVQPEGVVAQDHPRWNGEPNQTLHDPAMKRVLAELYALFVMNIAPLLGSDEHLWSTATVSRITYETAEISLYRSGRSVLYGT